MEGDRRRLETEHLLLLLRRFEVVGRSEDGRETAFFLPRQRVLLWVDAYADTYRISTVGAVSFGQARNWLEVERG